MLPEVEELLLLLVLVLPVGLLAVGTAGEVPVGVLVRRNEPRGLPNKRQGGHQEEGLAQTRPHPHPPPHPPGISGRRAAFWRARRRRQRVAGASAVRGECRHASGRRLEVLLVRRACDDDTCGLRQNHFGGERAVGHWEAETKRRFGGPLIQESGHQEP